MTFRKMMYLSLFSFLIFSLGNACGVSHAPPDGEQSTSEVLMGDGSILEVLVEKDTTLPEPGAESPGDTGAEKLPEQSSDFSEVSPDESISEHQVEAGEPTVEMLPEEVPEPRKCLPEEACNALLQKDGKCPGKCIPQRTKMACRGKVMHGLCYRKPPNFTNAAKTIKGLLFQPGAIPSLVRQGETKTFEISVTNTLSTSTSIPLQYGLQPNWRLVDASFKNLKTLDFKPKETKKLTLKVLALKADIFNNSLTRGRIITFSFDRDSFSIVSTIGYPAQGNVACGQHFFPARYCPTTPCSQNRGHYFRGKCCQGVFYPGIQCCQASDCQKGACFDGKCVEKRPWFLANNMPLGHQKVLIVMSDFLDQPHEPGKVCTNRFKDLKAKLKIEDFEKYFDKLSRQFLGRAGPKFQWIVYAGINTKDFNPSGGRDMTSMHRALEQYLVKKGCIKSAKDFDKRVLITPNVSIGGFTGKAQNDGKVAQKKIDMYLFAHELAHTYGATDLYLDQGGKLHYLFDLMGNNLGRYGYPEFAVAWGEMLWGDANRNGVIDVFEFALYPDSLVATKIKAQLSPKRTLEVTASVAAVEKGVQKDLFIRRITLELPDYGSSYQTTPGQTMVFSLRNADLEDIRKKGSVKVKVIASYIFTNQKFERKEVKLASTKLVTLTPFAP